MSFGLQLTHLRMQCGVRRQRPIKKRFLDLLQAIEQRLDSQIDRKMEAIESEIDALTPQIANQENDIDDFDLDCESEGHFEHHLEKIESKINLISGVVAGESTQRVDGEDRKRLKEKLKEAMRTENMKSSGIVPEREEWMEYLFGICKPDGRVGKPGSRCATSGNAATFLSQYCH